MLLCEADQKMRRWFGGIPGTQLGVSILYKNYKRRGLSSWRYVVLTTVVRRFGNIVPMEVVLIMNYLWSHKYHYHFFAVGGGLAYSRNPESYTGGDVSPW